MLRAPYKLLIMAASRLRAWTVDRGRIEMGEKKQGASQKRKPPISLEPLGFEEALDNLLKVRPPPEKPKRGGRKRGKEGKKK